ncbi:MAG: LysR family transcriptional regulator [Desulfobacterales bacterium]|nr:MAG: LysR family transcriptional regulator [Desulfobacterales bacterium]
MDLWQLHIFCKVVELKSFSKAGETIHLSQPTVSSHIKDLEDHLGCRLIDRMSKEALPTKAGELLYRYAKRLLALRNETETAMAEFKGKIKGTLVIGGSTIPGGYLLPQIVGAFTQQFPDIFISLVIGDTQKIINDTLEGMIEFGVVGARSGSKKISQEKLLDDEMMVIVPKHHPWSDKKSISVKMLLDEAFIIRESGSGTLKSIAASLSSVGYSIDDLKVVAEMGSTESVRQAIKHGAGISILSTLAVAEEVKAGALSALAVDGLNLTRRFYLTWHKSRSLSPLSEAFIGFLKKEVQKQ